MLSSLCMGQVFFFIGQVHFDHLLVPGRVSNFDNPTPLHTVDVLNFRTLVDCLFVLILYVPVNNFSVMLGWGC